MSQENNQLRYETLAEKWLEGTITPAEAKEYADWYNANQDTPLEIPASFVTDEATHELRMLQKLAERRGVQSPVVSLVPARKRIWWAAAAALVVGTGSYFWLQQQTPSNDPTNKQVAIQADVLPGSDKAILTLSNGQQILLDSASNGTLAAQGNASIIKQANGSLAYVTANDQKNKEILYNTMSIPRGGQYQLTLPDGSRVWLNAASTLKYPTSFTGQERVVELTGEGYFEVAQDAGKPFRVKVNGMQVAVLGTSFNIMAYPEEKSTNTTLLTGAVKVMQHQVEKILTPGQQAAVDNQSGQVTVEEVPTEQAIAWKEGMFRFSSDNIAMVLRQIGRWYNIDIVYQGKIPQGHITGKVPRNMKLSGVLRILELSGVYCKLEKEQLIILP
jgi:transmembrane sensor